MKNYIHVCLTVISFFFISCSGDDTNLDTPSISSSPNASVLPSTNEVPAGFLNIDGTTIVDDSGEEYMLKGVAFGNEVWSDKEVPTTHHEEEDFRRVADLNMNSVRFYLNYRTFEDDSNPYTYKETGWEWIDRNIRWSRNHGVKLLLNMHVPQGGFQSNGDGGRLWAEEENKNRLIALWRAIAERYKDEPQIVGFGILNEPFVPTIGEWEDLAQRAVDAIREVNTNHLIFVENAISIGGSFNISVDQSFFKVNDPVNKTVSEFHFYGPIEYTHQFASWIPAFRDQEGGTYPDPSRFTINGSSIWNSVGVATDNIPVGTTDWTYFESDRISLQDADVVLGIPVLEGQAVDNGRAFFDDVVIKEYDSNGNFLRNIFEIDGFIPDGWFHWAADGYLLGTWNDGAGREDNSAFVASGANGPTNISFWANRFPLTQGHSYQVTGWMRGENIPVGAMARIRLDYESTIDPNFSIETRNRDLLENRLLEYVEWGNRNNVPMYLGEFGCIRDCFENNRGGLNWVRDVISIAKENDMHFNYHAYHEDGFGIYRGYGTLVDPANANHELIELLQEELQ